VLDELFRNDGRTLRYGVGEVLYGFDAVIVSRRAMERPWAYGQDHHGRGPRSLDLVLAASACGKRRKMQTWIRFPEGWRIVAAHVSSSGRTQGCRSEDMRSRRSPGPVSRPAAPMPSRWSGASIALAANDKITRAEELGERR